MIFEREEASTKVTSLCSGKAEALEQMEKNWKFSASDWEERAYWDAYQKAFEDAINATATKESPWYVVPAFHLLRFFSVFSS